MKNQDNIGTRAMHRVVFAAALALFLVAGLAGGAFWIAAAPGDTGPDYEALKETMDRHRTHDKVNLDANDKLQVPTDPKDGIVYQLGSKVLDMSTGEVTTNLEGVARFYLPATDAHDVKSVTSGNDLAVYSGTSYDIALDASQEGFSAYVVVRDENAPVSYEFSHDLPAGFKLSEDGEGGIEVLNARQEVVGVIAAPWAVDANGVAVQTEYKLRGGVLVQTVNHIGAAYPVVADPSVTLGWNVYVWFDVPGEVSASGHWYTIVHAFSGAGACAAVTSLTSGVGGGFCFGAYLYWGLAGASGGYVNRCVNDIRRRPSQPLIQWRFHPHTVHRGRRLRSTQGPSDA